MNEYWRYREPFLPRFFAEAANQIGISRSHRLLDVACGTGVVAFGFAPYVGSITGIDIDKEVLDVARVEARRSHIEIDLIHTSIEDFKRERV